MNQEAFVKDATLLWNRVRETYREAAHVEKWIAKAVFEAGLQILVAERTGQAT